MVAMMAATVATELTVPHARRPDHGFESWRSWLSLWSSATVGALLIAVSYSIAAGNAEDQWHYPIFWLGMVLFFIPTVIVVMARKVRDRVRFVWLLVYGLFTYVPKLLRDPGAPLFHDEIAHLRQATNLVANGQLFEQNYIIGIIARFPGLRVIVTAFSDSTGLSLWQSALLLICIAHTLALFGAALLGDALLRSRRAGAVVALVYSLNSSFMYFDTEFAYESLAMPMFLLCLACLAQAHRAGVNAARLRNTYAPDRQSGEILRGGSVAAWTAAAAVLGMGVAPTHHLTAIILSLVLALVAAVTMFAALRGRVPWTLAWASVSVVVAVGGATASWLTVVAPDTFSYLSPYLGGSLGQLLRFFTNHGGSRTLFQASAEPLYERIAAFTVPAIAGVLALAAIVNWRRLPAQERWRQPMRCALGLFGLLYFPSVLFIMVQFGAEGARRTWGFTYIGLAVALSPLIVMAGDRIRDLDGRRCVVAGAASLLLACDALVGNVAAGLDEAYRFPGPFTFGSDARSFTPELDSMSAWFRANIGVGVRVISDRYTDLSLVRDADAHPAAPSTGFATYDLYFDAGAPSTYLRHELETSNYTYLILDKRMATQRPAVGVFFEPDEPFAFGAKNPVTPENLARYENFPWTTAVYESDSYVIYRFDFAAYGTRVSR
jgi:hypothetical protein